MPFVGGLFDALVQVRTIHHAADVPALFAQLARIAHPAGRYVLEFASKHHLKAIGRYWLGRQPWSPFALEPVEFAALNFDFHPRWMRDRLAAAGFRPGQPLTVSHFRQPLLKKIVPARWLARLDALIQPTGRWWRLSPSVFVASGAPTGSAPAPPGHFFACPTCRTPLGEPAGAGFSCPGCGRHWAFADGLYDFKTPR
jgi:hypothetical protein